MKPIDLAGFSAKFEQDPDPWSTWTARDERLKRQAILHALQPGRVGTLLELAAGNGSNSVMLARRTMRLDATEGTSKGVALTCSALAGLSRARASRLVVPHRPPRKCYHAIVIAELLYYLDDRAFGHLAKQVSQILTAGGALVLAHHRRTFYDFSQRADHIHKRFLILTGAQWKYRMVRRTRQWEVLSCTKRPAS